MAEASSEVNQWNADQLRFQAWLALPESARAPRRQQGFATEAGVAEETLSRWKRLPGFMDAVYALALADVRGTLGPILRAHAKLALKDLDSAKWVFEVAGAWTPKQRTELTGANGDPIAFDAKTPSYREGMTPFLPEAGGE